MVRVGEVKGFLELVRKAITQPALICGILSFGLALAAYSFVLTRLNLSIAYPIMVSMGLIIVVLASFFLLKEAITLIQIAGFILIIAGVWMVAK
jgi:multidrug transporter EmrE-like cation transporter